MISAQAAHRRRYNGTTHRLGRGSPASRARNAGLRQTLCRLWSEKVEARRLRRLGSIRASDAISGTRLLSFCECQNRFVGNGALMLFPAKTIRLDALAASGNDHLVACIFGSFENFPDDPHFWGHGVFLSVQCSQSTVTMAQCQPLISTRASMP